MTTKKSQYKNPSWWTTEHDSFWERSKAALKRDWDQTKHDFGGSQPDTDQDVDDTVAQAAGKQPIPPRGVRTFEEHEPLVRYGHAARHHYKGNAWDKSVEDRLRKDWVAANPSDDAHWNDRVGQIRYGWNYTSTTPSSQKGASTSTDPATRR